MDSIAQARTPHMLKQQYQLVLQLQLALGEE
jgi:hypothetical protein